MYAKRISIDEVPDGDEAAAEWLQKLYQQKVALPSLHFSLYEKNLLLFRRNVIL